MLYNIYVGNIYGDILMRKKLALLTSQLEDEYQKDFITGFLEQAFDKDYDVCIFSCFQKEPETSKRAVSEKNLFNLVNYDEYDGIVVMPDILQTSGLMMRIESNLREYSGKVLYVDRESDTYPYIIIDHYRAIYKLVSHIIEEHGVNDIAFVAGHKWHPFSKQRLSAYIDCLKDHNIEVSDDYIYYGDYWMTGGAQAVYDMLEKFGKLPKAIACANDYMAIGASRAIVEKGYRVPEDVIVVGYDCVADGRSAPIPITSGFLPTKEFGVYAGTCIDDLINDKELPEFIYEPKLFMGGSCGCQFHKHIDKDNIGKSWLDSRRFYMAYNRLTEELVLQSSFHNLIDSVQTYTYMFREFDLFEMYLNDVWLDGSPIENTAIHEGYSEYVRPILRCGRSGEGEDKIDLTTRINTKIISPHIHEEKDKPRAFIISPLFFEDVTFGYAVLSYGNETKTYGESYVMWLKSVLIGLENYRRNTLKLDNKHEYLDGPIKDTLTNMFNYEGFVKHAKPMIERSESIAHNILVVAVDMIGLDKINAAHGRKGGDKAIQELAAIINRAAGESDMCCRLGNDEFIIVSMVTDYGEESSKAVFDKIDKYLKEHNNNPKKDFSLNVYKGSAADRIATLSQMEDLVNKAVSHKNGNKAAAQRNANVKVLSEEEQKVADIVQTILDENLFNYHFQPIVSAKNGSIYAYEALMRANVKERVSPLDIIKYAGHYNRLYDVEKATMFNVLERVYSNPEEFKHKKVFVNSIPGEQLNHEDVEKILPKMKEMSDKFVIELTEQTEATDEMLDKMKEFYKTLGIETAVDDYGTGYSNIVNLLRYMPDYVKIDRMLLSNIQENPQKQHFVREIVLFAHDNHFMVLAEGIETKEELEKVIKLKVDLIQGYYTARPSAEVIPEIDEEIANQIKEFSSI